MYRAKGDLGSFGIQRGGPNVDVKVIDHALRPLSVRGVRNIMTY